MQKQIFIFSLFFIFIISGKSFGRFEWVVIERGTYQGSGFARDKWTAIDRCAADMEKKFIALAQKCCQNTETTTSAQYGNRCAGGYNGDQNSRSFDGGLAAYFCWPSGTYQEMASGYWLVMSTVRDYTCSELMDLNVPLTTTTTTTTTTYPTTMTPTYSPVPYTSPTPSSGY